MIIQWVKMNSLTIMSSDDILSKYAPWMFIILFVIYYFKYQLNNPKISLFYTFSIMRSKEDFENMRTRVLLTVMISLINDQIWRIPILLPMIKITTSYLLGGINFEFLKFESLFVTIKWLTIALNPIKFSLTYTYLIIDLFDVITTISQIKIFNTVPAILDGLLYPNANGKIDKVALETMRKLGIMTVSHSASEKSKSLKITLDGLIAIIKGILLALGLPSTVIDGLAINLSKEINIFSKNENCMRTSIRRCVDGRFIFIEVVKINSVSKAMIINSAIEELEIYAGTYDEEKFPLLDSELFKKTYNEMSTKMLKSV